MRGASSTGRRLVFHVDGIELDLRLEPVAGVPHGREVEVLGCIQGMTPPRVVTFRPLEAGTSTTVTMTVALDGFFEGRLPAGLMSIEIESPELHVTVPSPEIRIEDPGTR